MMKRRVVFLLNLLVLVMVDLTEGIPSNSQLPLPLPNIRSSKSNIFKTKVLIIGAGLSGLEAARLLNEHSIETVVIEARNRIGGRVWSVKINDHVFDAGASWIHGIDGSIPSGLLSNPLWDITKEARIETRSTDEDEIRFLNTAEQNLLDAQNWFDKYNNYLQEKTREIDTTTSIEFHAMNFIQENNLTGPLLDLFKTYLHIRFENEEGADMEMINAKSLLDLTDVHFGEEHIFHKTGYSAITDYLAMNVKDIRLEQVVTKIDYTSVPVQVHTEDENIYQADYVLITVPLGVLKKNCIRFEPALPAWKTDAIERIGFGLMNKIILLWDKAWWNFTEYFFMRVHPTNQYTFWVNADKWNDKPALVCLVVGSEAERIEMISNDTQIIEHILEALREMFPNQSIASPIGTFVTRWKSDRFSYGGYSYISVKQNRQDPFYLSEPVAERLLFAGEATNADTYGFAHGALTSGRREFTRLMHDYELGSQTKRKNISSRRN